MSSEAQSESGMSKLIEHQRAQVDAASNRGSGPSKARTPVAVADLRVGAATFKATATFSPVGLAHRESRQIPELLLQATLVVYGQKTTEGHIIEAVSPPWSEILRELDRDPDFLFKFPPHSRKFEELIAGAYEQDNWKVELTRHSDDGGVDIKATKAGHIELRLIDQVKALSAHRVVTADDVRALAGVLLLNPGVQIGVVTTTSRFAPGIENEFKSLSPRLQLRDGKQLLAWLKELAKARSQ